MPFSLSNFCQAAQHQRTLFHLDKFIAHRSPQLESVEARPEELQQIDACIEQEIKALNLANYNIKAATELEAAISRLNHLPENCGVLLGSSVISFVEELLLAFAKDTSVLTPQFDYFLYDITFEKLRIKSHKFGITQGGHWDLEDALRMQREHEPAITLLSTPNNPISRATPLEFIDALASNTNGLLVIDEVYHLHANDPHGICRLLNTHENLVILRSMAKNAFAATSFGYAMGNSEVIDCLKILKGGTTISPLSIAAGKALIENHEILAKHISSRCQWRNHMRSSIEQHTSFTCLPSETDFLIIETPEGQADAYTAHLQNAGIPCISYAPIPQLSNCIRLMPSNIPDTEALNDLIYLLTTLHLSKPEISQKPNVSTK
ncbi:Histidinol-phosphate aminotransferase [Pseudovibrio sp. FO-BEG1]|uniref:aminotransferase class I/II-fold pyridoxal phosphate-dependent enzyme n=1 Tax=Pseudovibrio sp. (strain FO-BEG1) TaxID=911045 RepID=UPI000238D3FA|nr:aminotransferase class I/II-fold pyridoxal phosphate-dependent enzyme [Pseudovibrio sp. FO-BEG1]AEV39340.1 Histidinol-phosphate aminotransferase [Pseudovibrio sp. FO-BEG1]